MVYISPRTCGLVMQDCRRQVASDPVRAQFIQVRVYTHTLSFPIESLAIYAYMYTMYPPPFVYYVCILYVLI